MNRTPLYEWHAAHGGRMVDFAGWEMPIQYTSIIEEHQAVRQAAGIFDISHMGRLRLTGPAACAALDRIITNDVARLEVGQVRYSLVCNESGGILDDVLVYRFDDCYQLVVNASNREKIIAWIDAHSSPSEMTMEDETLATCMVAVQGPNSLAIVQSFTDVDLASLRYFSAVGGTIDGVACTISRTGYTGEDGFEVIVPGTAGQDLWEALMGRGQGHGGLLPCGLGARDTLRLEAGMPLYGHELSDTIDPLTAGLAFGVKLNAADFIGKAAIQRVKDSPTGRKRVGLQMEGRRIAREGAELYCSDRHVGTVTSGTFSPTLRKSIAMGYVPVEFSSPGTALEVDLRGKREQALVVPLPFYKRTSP